MARDRRRSAGLAGKSRGLFRVAPIAICSSKTHTSRRAGDAVGAPASLYTYCIYELRFSEDEAFRRVAAARLVRRFPKLFDSVASGELHLTGLLMLGPHLTEANLGEVLARAKHRTKRELARLVRLLDPLPAVPARIEPLGPAPAQAIPATPSWEQYVQSMNPMRELAPSERPRDWMQGANDDTPTAPARADSASEPPDGMAPASERGEALEPLRYKVQFTASEEYVRLVEQAKALLSHAVPGVTLEELQLRAMRSLVSELSKRKYAAVSGSPERNAPTEAEPGAHEPAEQVPASEVEDEPHVLRGPQRPRSRSAFRARPRRKQESIHRSRVFASNQSKARAASALKLATDRRAALAEWSIGEPELAKYCASTSVRVITPGVDAGELLHVLSPLERRSSLWNTDPDSARQSLSAAVSLVLRLLDRNPDPASSREHVLLSLCRAPPPLWRQRRDRCADARRARAASVRNRSPAPSIRS